MSMLAKHMLAKLISLLRKMGRNVLFKLVIT